MITWQDVPIVESQRPELLPLDLQNEYMLYDHLVTAVQETIQPSFVQLWLRKPERRAFSRDQ